MIYLIDNAGALVGPVVLPPVPGVGYQLPSNGVELPTKLKAAATGFAWTLLDGQPTQVLDCRGDVYDTTTGFSELWQVLGPIPATFTQKPKPSDAHQWLDGEWVQHPSVVHSQQVAKVNEACESEIIGGFVSSALGAPYLYSSQLDDQLNLTGMILRGMDGLYACRDESGAKEFRPHTAEQLHQVGDDFTAFKQLLLQKANRLKKLLDQALADGDLAALEFVTWESPQS